MLYNLRFFTGLCQFGGGGEAGAGGGMMGLMGGGGAGGNAAAMMSLLNGEAGEGGAGMMGGGGVGGQGGGMMSMMGGEGGAGGGAGGMMGMMGMIPNMVNGIRESTARAALTNIVRFVIGETATPSPEMVSFAVVAGSSPTTQGERDAYLEMLKEAARKTPAVASRFMKSKVVNGTQTMELDKIALDAHITKKAMQYGQAAKARSERKKKEEKVKRQHELQMLRTSQMHELNMIAMMGIGMNPSSLRRTATTPPPSLDALYMDSTTFLGNPAQRPGQVARHHSPTGNAPSAADGMISLTDIYRMLDQQVKSNTGSGSSATNAPIVPPATAAPVNTGGNMDLNSLLLGSMVMK